MTSNLDLDLTPRATQDIRDITRVSEYEWGEAQALAYLGKISTALDHICMFPEMGKRVGAIQPDLRSRQVESHVIFYEIHADRIRVIRVLHQRMNAQDELSR